MSACTIVAANYVAMARILAASFEAHHPGVPFSTLIIDGDEADRDLEGLGTVVLPSDLSLPAQQWGEMASIYDVTELATAAKPALLEHVLDRHRTATYFDPDIKVYAPVLPELEGLAPIRLTPHCLEPVPRDGLVPTEHELMGAGLFNLGFISVTQAGRPFLRWWQDRLHHDALMDPSKHLFTDQRWIDWVPSLFEHSVLRDPGFNVAYWNAHERAVTRSADGTVVAGDVPLRFFHFSGFDLDAPWQLSRHATGRPRVHLMDAPVLQVLCADYADELERGGHAERRRQPYRLAQLSDGFTMTPEVRRMVRRSILDGASVPNPYDSAEAFRQWLSEPVQGTPAAPLTRWDQLLWDGRPDLQQLYPEVHLADAAGFRAWLHHDFEVSHECEHLFGPPPELQRPRRAMPGSEVAWSIVAYADAELGIGETGRRMARAMLQVGTPTEVVGVGETLSRRQHVHGLGVAPSVSFANTITCANANVMPRVWHSVGIRPDEGHRIALWFWEVDRFPEEWWPRLSELDQVWVTSAQTLRMLEQIGLCQVEQVRLPVLPPSSPTHHTRAQLGLPEDRFTFLCSFDFLSVMKRKNPLDVLTAYTAAFGPDDGATLVLKSINGHLVREQLGLVISAAARRPDVVVVDGYRSAAEVSGMIEHADCLVSLHRSEGYGLNLIDAMALGTPVVATGYSGNMTFMDESSAFLVPYEEVLVGEGSAPYPADAHWAQPDLVAASGILREVFDHPAAARERGQAGQRKVLLDNSLEVVGAQLRALTHGVLAGVPA